MDGSRIKKKIIWENDIPWQVGLLRDTSGIFCGGVLLTNQFILSAAHCKRKMKFDHDDYAVMGSRLKYRTLKPEDMHRICPEHHIHPKNREFLK